jgi:hypothetical protein
MANPLLGETFSEGSLKGWQEFIGLP